MPQTRQPPAPFPHPALGLPFLCPCWCTGAGQLGITLSEPSCAPCFPSSLGLRSEGLEGWGAGGHLSATAQGSWGYRQLLLPVPLPLPSPSPWDHWGQEMGCSDSISNDETNFNPMLSDTLFPEYTSVGRDVGKWSEGELLWTRCVGGEGRAGSTRKRKALLG